jgi:predicted CXXCH cytochrome family protein
MLNNTSVVSLCGMCHDWEEHASHPIGPKFKDKRNPNLTMVCLSCHRAHGTEYQRLIPYPTVSALCVSCHQKYKR